MQMLAFDDFYLHYEGNRTRLTIKFYCEYRGESVAQQSAAAMQKSLESSREGMLRNLNNLKLQLESQ